MDAGRLLVYLLRRDLRTSDNPILHHLATSSDHGFTHLLPLYVFPAQQVEVSGFLKDGQRSPYPEARSRVGAYWRCGPHRAKFVAQSVWDMKDCLQQLNSGLVIRVGDTKDVLSHLIRDLEDKDKAPRLGAVWMTEELSWEEVEEQNAVAALCSDHGLDFRLWADEKYFIDDRDTGLLKPKDLPDVFTTYRKSQEPLRQRPRKALPSPDRTSLPPLPDGSTIPPQHDPFVMPNSLEDLEACLLRPLQGILTNPPQFPDGAESSHPFRGGENPAHERLGHLIKSGAMTTYKDSRNGLLGLDFSTKLSAHLALGCISARQMHEELLKFEDGTDDTYRSADGYGRGENEGTAGIRFELLWRDYMRLCTAKFGRKLFKQSGFTQDGKYDKKWKTANKEAAESGQEPSPEEISKILERFREGTMGMGLIDAAQRELFLTGYTSNRARQNAASFLSKHLNIDWRYGAEWYEMMLVDYDVSSNWANWQYIAGVGNDPRGDARIFNPVKQAFDYDKDGSYVRTWVPELRDLEKPENVFQAWTTSSDELDRRGLAANIMVTDPVKRIEFTVDRKPRSTRRPFSRRRGGQGRGGRRGGNGATGTSGTTGANGGNAGNGGNGGHGGHGGQGGNGVNVANGTTGANGANGTGGTGGNPGQGRPAKASEAAQPGPELRARHRAGNGPMAHHARGGSSSRGKYNAPQTYFPNGYGGGAWHGDCGLRGAGNYGYFHDGGRWYGQWGGFHGGYQYHQPTYGPVPIYPPPPNMSLGAYQ